MGGLFHLSSFWYLSGKHTHTFTTQMHTYTHTYTQTRTHTNTHIYKHARMVHTNAYKCTQIQINQLNGQKQFQETRQSAYTWFRNKIDATLNLPVSKQ